MTLSPDLLFRDVFGSCSTGEMSRAFASVSSAVNTTIADMVTALPDMLPPEIGLRSGLTSTLVDSTNSLVLAIVTAVGTLGSEVVPCSLFNEMYYTVKGLVCCHLVSIFMWMDVSWLLPCLLMLLIGFPLAVLGFKRFICNNGRVREWYLKNHPIEAFIAEREAEIEELEAGGKGARNHSPSSFSDIVTPSPQRVVRGFVDSNRSASYRVPRVSESSSASVVEMVAVNSSTASQFGSSRETVGAASFGESYPPFHPQ